MIIVARTDGTPDRQRRSTLRMGCFCSSFDSWIPLNTRSFSIVRFPRFPSHPVANTIISLSDEWKYTSESQVTSSWTSPSFFDASWSSYHSGEFPLVSSPTRYYRRRSTLPSNKLSFTLAEMGVKTREGFILYINGQEVYRFLLPEGTIHSNYTIQHFDSQLVYHVYEPLIDGYE